MLSTPDLEVNNRILLVEDNHPTRQLLGDYLARYCGYSVFSIADGSEFVAAVDGFQPNLILLDLKLPTVDGYTLLEQTQQTPEWCHIPIIVISAFAFYSDQQRALKLGARRYLVKPIRLIELQEAIRSELDCLSS